MSVLLGAPLVLIAIALITTVALFQYAVELIATPFHRDCLVSGIIIGLDTVLIIGPFFLKDKLLEAFVIMLALLDFGIFLNSDFPSPEECFKL